MIPTRKLPEHPDLDQLKRQAKELLDSYLAGEHTAVTEVKAVYNPPPDFALHDAQLVVARSYGFQSWPKLKARVDGVTVARLCQAAERGDTATAADLLRRRPEIVNLEWPGHGEMRALHVAVLRRDPAMVQLLMEHAADPFVGIYPNRDATAALIIAVEREYSDIVAIIRKEMDRRNGSRPLPTAAFRELAQAGGNMDQDQIIALLQKHPDLMQFRGPGGSTALHRAASGFLDRVSDWLLDHGADANARTDDGWTPLDIAADQTGHRGTADQFAALAKIFRKHGVLLTSVSAVALGDTDWVRARHAEGKLEKPATLDLFRPFGGLLTTAVKHNQIEMLRLLLDLGFDPDERVRLAGTDDVEYTWGMPLHNCAGSGKIEMARMLVERGADPNAQVSTSGSPIFAAYQAKDPAMIALLESHGGVLDAASVGYVHHVELARKMLAGEADPRLEFGKFSGETAAEQLLWSGASGGDPEIVRMSLEKIDWKRDDPRWFSMLCRPLTANNADLVECFRLILERCDANVRHEQFGQTILHEVVARDEGTHLELVKMLLDAGARTNIRDELLRSTPLGWACRWGRKEIAKFLLSRGADPVEADADAWATPHSWARKKQDRELQALLA